MKIEGFSTKQGNINFKSGLSSRNLRTFQSIPISTIDQYFKSNNVGVQFKDNDSIAVLNMLCSWLLKKLDFPASFNKFSLKTQPNSIRVFDRNELLGNFPDTFCSTVSKKIILNEPEYKPASLFFANTKTSIEQINDMANKDKRTGYVASGNFLSYTMHEWMHSAHLNYLYRQYGSNEAKVAEYIDKLKKIELSNREKQIIQEYLGDYVYMDGKANPMEIIAEGLNKIICSSLSEKEFAIIANVDDVVQKMPRELISLLQKLLSFTPK